MQGDYVCGLEPATWWTDGRAEARKKGELLFLQPAQEYITELRFEIAEM